MRISDWSSDVCSSDLWNALLQSLARQIRALGGNDFRAIHTGTWREDWPDRREASVARIRAVGSAATADGGTALVIPARSNGRGAEQALLHGLSYRPREGLAPHPFLRQWSAGQVAPGAVHFRPGGGGTHLHDPVPTHLIRP